MAEPKYVSINPDTFTQGGLVDDVDAVVKSFRAVEWNYQGKSDAVLAFHLNFVTKDGDEYDQYYSAGDLKRMVPSDDGKHIVFVAGSGTVIEQSNAGQFMASLVNAGFPKTKLGSDLSVIDGLGAHLRRVAQPERKGLKKAEGERQAQVLIVTEVLWLPGETPKFTVGAGNKTATGPGVAGKSVGAPTSTLGVAAGPAVVQSTEDPAVIGAKTRDYILGILAASGGTANKSTLPQALFKACAEKQDPNQGAILQMAFRGDYLTAGGHPWKYDANTGQLSLG